MYGVLAGTCILCLQAAEREPAAPVFQAPPDASADVQALENYRLVTLESAHFAAGKCDLKPDEEASLDSFVKRFRGTNGMVIELRGYANGAGSIERDLALSTERTKAIARFLIKRGIPSQRILILGLGEIDPAGSALNPAHERVDIRIFMAS